MKRRVSTLAALLVVLIAAGVAWAEEKEQAVPPPVGRTEKTVAGNTVVEAVAPGPIVAALTLPAAEGGGLLLLVRGEDSVDSPRSLYRFDPRPGGKLEEIRAHLPGGYKALFSGDLDGDGRLELLAGGMGELDTLGPIAGLGSGVAPRSLVRHPGFDPRSLAPNRLAHAGHESLWLAGGFLAVAEVGSLRLYQPSNAGLKLARRLELPITVKRESTGLELRGARVEPLPAKDGTLRFAVGPEERGDRRLVTRLIELPPGGEPTSIEAWSRLPGPEEVEVSRVLEVDGKLILFALTQTRGELNLFENRRLRAFSLGADRTRQGRLPLAAFETGAPRWADPRLVLRDLDGDGKQELVMLYEKGLVSQELAIEALPGLGGGRFGVKALRTEIKPAPPLFHYGSDVNGDGRPDLLTSSGSDLAIHFGGPGKRVVEPKPGRVFPLVASTQEKVIVELSVGGEGAAARRVAVEAGDEIDTADLDGDGRLEILVLRPSLVGRGVMSVVRLGG